MDPINNHNRSWRVLCWNIRGINSTAKWNAIKSKVVESGCDIICLQETKREIFDTRYIKNLCTSSFDSYEYVSSIGASSGIITLWKSSRFSGQLIFNNRFALSIEMKSNISGASWILTNVYAPCSTDGREEFLAWMNSIDMPDDTDWLLVGDFDLIRRLSDRNKSGGNTQNMLDFNAAISNLRLEELKLNGNRVTWTNNQRSPLLERLDWFLASISWMIKYPGSFASTLSRDISDHCSCLISMATDIPKPHTFRFDKFWLLHEEFMQVFENGWNIPCNHPDKARRLVAKYKTLRRVLRQWQQQLSNLSKLIEHNMQFLTFLDTLEEFRDLVLEEWNFKKIVHDHLTNLLEQQRVYWKQRGRIKWATLGEENTKFFHATATIRHNKNSILVLKTKRGWRNYLMRRKLRSFGKPSKKD
jgi:hypothetical protein